MEQIAKGVVERLSKARELPLSEIVSMLPKQFNDHRDLYVIASLIKNGYADIYLEENGRPVRDDNERQLSINLYIWAQEPEFEYMGMKSTGSDFRNEKIFCSAKADLYLSDQQSKRNERLFAIVLAVFIAILSAYSTSYFTNDYSAKSVTL